MMTDPAQKLYAIMRLWEFLDQYVVEPTDGSSASLLAVSRLDGSMNLVDEIPQCTKLRVPKIQTIYGVVGTLKLLAGKFCVAVNLPEYSSQSVISCFSLPFDTYCIALYVMPFIFVILTNNWCRI
ncbi:phosphoinositide phosphatase SAC6-like [Salvia splendens]|uniref:phosphoinositide phosphatase SAC6-like n=1 Tax=Salvia splendens TaxID=180675 RepID=UPI001C26B97C|nr:phosphoinositide phosphatase SAC6-like [Salvia splendens]